MSTMKWTDATSYSRGQQGKTEPSTWETKVNGVKIVVTKYVGWGGEWTTCCHPLYDTTATGTEDLEKAKTKALKIFAEATQRFAEANMTVNTFLKYGE